MSRIRFILTLLFGVGLSAAWAQEVREKGGAPPAEKTAASPPGARAAPSGAPAAGSAAGRASSASSDRGRMEGAIRQYAESLLKKYDEDSNGKLEKDEWSQTRGSLREADTNGDGIITADELTAYYLQRTRRSPEMMRAPFSPSVPPSARVEYPGGGGLPFPTRPSHELLRMSSKPLDPRAPTVAMQFLVAELVAESGGSFAARNLGGRVEVDMTAPSEQLKESLGSMGLRGRWESFRRVQLSSADGQAAYINVGQSEPTIRGISMTAFGRTNSISHQNTGFIVGAQPHVGPGGTITIEVDVSASRQGGDEEGVPILVPTEGDTVKSLPVHQVLSRTFVRVADGKTVVVTAISRGGASRRELIILLSAQVMPRTD